MCIKKQSAIYFDGCSISDLSHLLEKELIPHKKNQGNEKYSCQIIHVKSLSFISECA